jgi:hypothetical protein
MSTSNTSPPAVQPSEEYSEPTGPFDPREEVSADAHHIAQRARADAREASGRIIRHLWIIFVLLPVVAYVLVQIIK